MLGVSSLPSIHFEENDGTEIAFNELFDYRTSIGSGGFGFVAAVLDKDSGEEVALKLLNKETASQKVIDLFKKEAKLLETFCHPNVVKFKFLKNFSNYICLGMELCTGGTLTDWAIAQRSVEETMEQHEENCAKIIKNILLGIQYVHDDHEMIHRDLKPSNILFLHRDDLNSLKICDFGLANKVGTGLFDQNYENVGTIMYQAPEQMSDAPSYGKAADMWAVGMIMYELLSKGGHPILGEDIHQNIRLTVDEYKNKMKNNQVKLKYPRSFKNVSKLAKNLLKNLCDFRPNHRYNCHRALKHPWITRDLNGVIPLSFHQELEINMGGSDESPAGSSPDALSIIGQNFKSATTRNRITVEKFTNDIQSESEEYFSDEAEERASNDYSPEGTDEKDSSPNMSALKSSSTANDSKYVSQLSMSKRLAKPKKSSQSKMLNRSVKKPPKYTKRNRSERKRPSSITKMASEKHAGKDSVAQQYSSGVKYSKQKSGNMLLPPIGKYVKCKSSTSKSNYDSNFASQLKRKMNREFVFNQNKSVKRPIRNDKKLVVDSKDVSSNDQVLSPTPTPSNPFKMQMGTYSKRLSDPQELRNRDYLLNVHKNKCGKCYGKCKCLKPIQVYRCSPHIKIQTFKEVGSFGNSAVKLFSGKHKRSSLTRFELSKELEEFAHSFNNELINPSKNRQWNFSQK